MSRKNLINSLFSCFGGVTGPPPTATALQTPKEETSGVALKHGRPHEGLLEVIPILWSYLSGPERLAIRTCCRDSRRIHDTLVTDIFVCDDAVSLSGVPAARLPRYPLPVFTDASHQISQTLQGFRDRGCQPRLLFLCLTDGHERRRHDEGLAVLLALSDAANKLSVVHLCGVPLTPQVARALNTLLPSPTSMTCTTPPPAPSAAPSAATLARDTPLSLMAVSLGPPTQPLSLNLYGYDLERQPAAAAAEMLVTAAAPRLTRLELWGCVGWPKRLATLLQSCSYLRHMSVSFQPLLSPDGTVIGGDSSYASGSKVPATHGSQTISPQQRAAAAVAAGAVVAFPPIAAAATTAAVVKTVGSMHHLRSLELRGCVLNLTRRASCETLRVGGGGGGVVRPRTAAAAKAAADRAAVAASAPSVQQLASALYQLTCLTRLAIEGLTSAVPLLAAVAAMRGLRHLELPDAAAPAATDLAAIARAAPRLASLTLGSVGPGSLLDAGGAAVAAAAAAAAAAPEVLPLPPALAVLRVVRCRPTLRTMRSLRRTVEARAAAGAEVGAADGATAGDGAPSHMVVVVPGIEIDMLDVEFDALQGFTRGSDGVMRATLLPESAEALAAAIRLLAPPASQRQGWDTLTDYLGSQQGDGCASGAVPSSVAGSLTMPPFASTSGPGGGRFGCSSVGEGFGRGSVGGGNRFLSTGSGCGSGGGGGGSGIFNEDEKDGGSGAGGAEWAPSFGQSWTRELTIHNSQGSLGPPAVLLENQQQNLPPAGPLERLPEAEAAVSERCGAAGGGGGRGGSSGLSEVDVGCLIQPVPVLLVGHAVWISEMRPLGLTSLELYGIGIMAGDLEAMAELSTLRRLTLASGELEVDALPCLAALPLLEYLELARCHPCRHRRHGRALSSRASTGTGFARASGGAAGFARASGGVAGARVSYADSDAAADGDGGELRPTGKRALLELCMTAPALRHVFVVRYSGMVSRSEGAEGPLGAEWVRQRLLAAGPRYKTATPAAAAGAGEEAGLQRVSWLGRASKPVTRVVTEGELGWPEVRWD